MKILYLTFALQHPTMRGPTRCYNFLRELSQHHSVTLLTVAGSEVTAEAVRETELYAERVVLVEGDNGSVKGNAEGGKVFSRVVNKFHQSSRHRKVIQELKRRFAELVEQDCFDVIFFHGKSIFQVIEGFTKIPIVIDFCDATSMRVRQSMRHATFVKKLWLALRYSRVRETERRMIQTSPHLAFISSRDRDAVIGQRADIRVVPLGMDLEYWRRKTTRPQANCILYTGSMDYQPNADGAHYLIDRILPILRNAIPDLEVFIVGRNPSPELLDKGEKHTDVTVTGSVKDMRPYFEKASVYVAPLRFCSGMQNKLLEAFAMQVPVVTSPIAADGFRLDGGGSSPLLVAEGENQFAEQIVLLLQCQEERQRLAAEGRRFVETHFVWSQNAKILENMFLDAITKKDMVC